MESPLVSIIIPFFNEEICLSRAVQSALNQSYGNTEIILVNDGSTDNSKAIAENFCSLHPHIQLINSQNESLGAARNKGMAVAKGAYITFLDADDELNAEMISLCLEQLLNGKSDVVISKFTLVDEREQILKVSGWKGLPKVISANEAILSIYANKIVPTAWGKLYKAEIIKNLRFPERIWFEDNPFLLEVFFNCKKIALVNKSLLNIYSRKTSITRRVVSKKRIVDINKAFYFQLAVVDKYMSNIPEKQKIIEKIGINQINAMLDTFIVLSIDKSQIDNGKIIQDCYLECLSDLKDVFKERKIKLPLKRNIVFSLLYAPKYMTWSLPELLIIALKRKKYKYLRNLKG